MPREPLKLKIKSRRLGTASIRWPVRRNLPKSEAQILNVWRQMQHMPYATGATKVTHLQGWHTGHARSLTVSMTLATVNDVKFERDKN